MANKAAASKRTTKATHRKSRPKPKLIPRTHRPADMTLEQWQIALRRQFGRDQKFKLEAVDGGADLFGDYLITNPETERTYRVGIRGSMPGENHCTCPDFAVNTLGTCKHVEFTLAKLERKSGARAKLKAGYRPPFTEVLLRYGSDRRVVVRAGTDLAPSSWKKIAPMVDADGALRPAAFDQFESLVEHLQHGDHEVRVHEDAVAYLAQVRDRARLVERVDALFPKGADDRVWKGFIKRDLYPYQKTGALFAARGGRVLLADDMGLGKTIQSIAAAEILARAAGVERVLVVAPTSLKHQWKREIETFTNRSAVVVEGSGEQRRKLFEGPGFFKITNYETIHLDNDLIATWAPDLIILDEAQRIKNWKTRTAQTVKELQSQYAIVLSGTPLENRLEELHSIVAFVDRYRLGPMFRFLDTHQQLNEEGRVVGYRALNSITKTLGPILLRRTKTEVLKQLPGRIEQHFLLPMTPEQKRLHEENREVVARLVHRWRRMKFLTEADQNRLNCALQNMRMSCNSTYLLDPETDFGTKADEIIERLDDVLATDGAKVVIFSQWVRSHELLIRRLNKAKRKFVFLHGGVPGPKRQALVDQFREDDRCRVFLSTDAGGVGLNLQVASAVFNMDQPWNPAILEQRIGRVHRLGQTRPVQVMHFVARDTIEQGMLDVIKFKRSLFAGVLDGDQDSVFMGGTRLKKFMDGVEAATSAIPAGDGASVTPPVPAPELKPEAVTAAPIAHPIAPLVETLVGLGQAFLGSLAPRPEGTNTAAAKAPWAIETDAATGEPYLKLPMPSPDLIAQAGQLVAMLAARFLPKG